MTEILLLASLQVANAVLELEFVASADDGSYTGRCGPLCLTVRLVHNVMGYTGTPLIELLVPRTL